MLWKQLMTLAALTWLTASYAAQPVVEPSIDEALAQKHETPGAQKERQRGVAEEKGQGEVANEPAQDAPMRYWRWEDSSPTN